MGERNLNVILHPILGHGPRRLGLLLIPQGVPSVQNPTIAEHLVGLELLLALVGQEAREADVVDLRGELERMLVEKRIDRPLEGDVVGHDVDRPTGSTVLGAAIELRTCRRGNKSRSAH